MRNSAADLATSLDKIDGVVDHGLIIKTRLVSPNQAVRFSMSLINSKNMFSAFGMTDARW